MAADKVEDEEDIGSTSSDSFINDSDNDEPSISGQDDEMHHEPVLTVEDIERLIVELLAVESKAAEAQEALEDESLAKVEVEVREELAQSLEGEVLESVVGDEMLALREKWEDELDELETDSAHLLDKMLHLREAHQAANPSGEAGSQQVNESAFYLNPGSWNSLTSNKPDETWKNKYLTTETKLRKLTRKTDTLKHTLEILCSRLDVPTPDFGSNDEDSDKEGSSGHANQN